MDRIEPAAHGATTEENGDESDADVSRETAVLRRIAASRNAPFRVSSDDGSLARLKLGRSMVGESMSAEERWRDLETGGVALEAVMNL